MSNKIKYSAALFVSLIIGLIGANTIKPSTYSYCAFAVGSLDNCSMNFTAIDKNKTFSDQIQRGLILGAARVSASNFVALDTDKKPKALSKYQFFIPNRTNCRK